MIDDTLMWLHAAADVDRLRRSGELVRIADAHGLDVSIYAQPARILGWLAGLAADRRRMEALALDLEIAGARTLARLVRDHLPGQADLARAREELVRLTVPHAGERQP